MERVENLLKGLKLSDVEKKGLRIGGLEGKNIESVDSKVIAKLLSDKHGHAEAMATALGRIWCPMKGATCEDMGDNVFIFTLRQESGKNKSLNEGPWMFNESLLVVEEFVPTNTAVDYVFTTIPIWIRMFGLPLGMMDRETGGTIGDEVGEFMEVEVGDDGFAKGKFLRVKVRINIKKPLMRGIMLDVGKEKAGLWCRFEYEYLPDFCFRCGLLDHIDRDCKVTLARGETAQYGSWLKAYIPRPNADHNAGVWDGARNSYDGRGRGNNRHFGFIALNGRSGSDKEDWRKKNDTRVVIGGKGGELDASVLLENSKGNELKDVEGNTIAEPLLRAGAKEQSNGKESEHISVVQENGKEKEDGEGAKSFVIEEVVHGVGHTAVPELGSETVPMHVD
ncbi:hypothetical protein ACQ4PT_051857 [Festuca glaucescens]